MEEEKKPEPQVSGKPAPRPQSTPSLLKNYCVIISSIIVILAGLHVASGILGPFLMATFFAVLLISPVNWLRHHGIASWLAFTVVIIGVLLVGVVAATILSSQIVQFARDIPEYRDRFVKTLENHNLDLSDLFPFLRANPDVDLTAKNNTLNGLAPDVIDADSEGSTPDTGTPPEHVRVPETEPDPAELTESPGVASESADPDVDDEVNEDDDRDDLDVLDSEVFDGIVRSLAQTTQSKLTPPSTPDLIGDGGIFGDSDEDTEEQEFGADDDDASGVTYNAVQLSSHPLFKFIRGLMVDISYFASTALLVTLLLVFMLVETAKIPKKLVAALGERKFTNTHILNVVEDIRRYMVIKTAMSLLVGTLVTILLYFARVQYPLLWGMVAFLLNYIPNIGSVAAAIPPVVLAMIDCGIVTGCIVAFFFILINCCVGYALEPRILGKGLDLSPLIVLLALIFFGWLLGPVGMFLSPPLAVVMKIIFQSFPETRWIAALMANSAPKESFSREFEESP